MNDIVTPTASTSVTPEIVTTETTSEVSKPLNVVKPYDDEMLDLYEAEEGQEEVSQNGEVKTEPEIKVEEPEQPPEAKSREGDREIDGLQEVKLTEVINGKTVDFKVKDAIQAFVRQEEFNRNMDRRVTVVAQREQRWNQEQAQFKDRINEVISMTQKGDFITPIRALAKLAAGGSGLDVVKFEKQYFDQLDKVREVYTKMTPEQRETYFAKRDLAEAQERARSLEEEKTVNTERSQLQEKVSSVQKELGLSEQEFWNNYKIIQDNLVGEGKFFRTPQEIETEDVIKFTLAAKHEEKVILAGKKLGVQDDAILDEVSRITASYPGLSVDDIAKVIEKSGLGRTASPQAVENLNRKAGKNKTQFNQASSTKKENGNIEGLDKEDLEFLYRKQPKVFARPVR